MPLRIDSNSGVIQGPQWVLGTKDTPPTEAPYDEQTSAPAAFLMSSFLNLQTTFQSNDPSLASCSITATLAQPDGSATPWGDISAHTVTFGTDGTSEPVTFTAQPQDPQVGAYDVVINWRAESCQTRTGSSTTGASLSLNTTLHRIYSLFGQPVAPMETPWAKVLELASAEIGTTVVGDLDESAIATGLTAGTFYSAWAAAPDRIRFFRPIGKYKYNPRVCLAQRCAVGDQYSVPLQWSLDKLITDDLEMECSDNAGLLSVLAAAEGVEVNPLELRSQTGDTMWTNPYYPAGDDTCHLSGFSFHAVGSLANVYDVSARCPDETSSGNCGNAPSTCEIPGGVIADVDLSTYLPLVFQNLTIGNTSAFRQVATICTAVNPGQ